MNKYHIYARDDGGIMEYRGVQEWDSLDDLISYYCVDHCQPEPAELEGWPTAALTWYGNLGVAQA
jgi:hypothetical protein